jgi:hypothetical protein
VSRLLTEALRKVENIVHESEMRLEESADAHAVDSTILIMHFPDPGSSRQPHEPARSDELA